jgi:HSP20 family molecular chaperone IbpA
MNLFANKNDNQLATPTETAPRRSLVPRYGVEEQADAFVVTAYLPGVARTDLETNVDGENLTVFGRRTWTPPAEWATVYRESANADFRLVLELDHRINREALKAELKHGVLTLTLPKAEAVKPRKIEIQG